MIRIVLRGLLVVAVLLTSAGSARAAGQEQILLKSTGSREQMRKAVEALGGRVTQEFQNVNAIAATVPSGGMAALAAFPEFKVAKDLDVAPPSPRDPAGESTGVVELGAGALVLGEAATGPGTTVPNDYLFNNTLIRADAVQASGNVGDGVVVVIIDTGTANSPTVGSLYGRVIGGQSFIPATVDGLSATRLLERELPLPGDPALRPAHQLDRRRGHRPGLRGLHVRPGSRGRPGRRGEGRPPLRPQGIRGQRHRNCQFLDPRGHGPGHHHEEELPGRAAVGPGGR
jgi:hypothetical protein